MQMSKSLRETVSEPIDTESAIRLALKTPNGLKVTWVIVEAEADVYVYEKLMLPDTTVVKTSVDDSGHKGYRNVEHIVCKIGSECPVAHIIGIRDADYSRYDPTFTKTDNVFLTDFRDLEMLLLKSDTVLQSLKDWNHDFENVFQKCVSVCRHFGYMRIYNTVYDLCVSFRELRGSKFWDFSSQSVATDWEQRSTDKFLELAGSGLTADDFKAFVIERDLENEDPHYVCQGHDLISLLSLSLRNVKVYSEQAIMQRMMDSYSIDDFRQTQLYADILEWQEGAGVTILSQQSIS